MCLPFSTSTRRLEEEEPVEFFRMIMISSTSAGADAGKEVPFFRAGAAVVVVLPPPVAPPFLCRLVPGPFGRVCWLKEMKIKNVFALECELPCFFFLGLFHRQ